MGENIPRCVVSRYFFYKNERATRSREKACPLQTARTRLFLRKLSSREREIRSVF